jgi:hypothetical protein
MISGLKVVAADDIRSDSLSKALRVHAVSPCCESDFANSAGQEIHLAY